MPEGVSNRLPVGQGEGFPKAARLRQRVEFDRVFAAGAKVVGPHFVGYVVREGEAGAKLGLTVSRKVGPAVVRNRVKRRVREWFRTHRAAMPPGLCLVVVARPQAARLATPGCHESLTALARRGGVLA